MGGGACKMERHDVQPRVSSSRVSDCSTPRQQGVTSDSSETVKKEEEQQQQPILIPRQPLGPGATTPPRPMGVVKIGDPLDIRSGVGSPQCDVTLTTNNTWNHSTSAFTTRLPHFVNTEGFDASTGVRWTDNDTAPNRPRSRRTSILVEKESAAYHNGYPATYDGDRHQRSYSRGGSWYKNAENSVFLRSTDMPSFAGNSARYPGDENRNKSFASAANSSYFFGASCSRRSVARSGTCVVNLAESTKTLRGAMATLRKHVQQGAKPLSLRSSYRDVGGSMGCSYNDDVPRSRLPSIFTANNAITPAPDGSMYGEYNAFNRDYDAPGVLGGGRGAMFPNVPINGGFKKSSVPAPHVGSLLELVDTSTVSVFAADSRAESTDDANKQQLRRVANNVGCSPVVKVASPPRQAQRNCRVVVREDLDGVEWHTKNVEFPVVGSDEGNKSREVSTTFALPGSICTFGATTDVSEDSGPRGWVGVGGDFGVSSSDWYARQRSKLMSDESDVNSKDGAGEVDSSGDAAEEM
ncbi:hypothetical protein, conserved [Trypanosoma brucei brucei TREU927]|uniref:Uncharacterized protein n=1 Tax=Trypanosoma brucei brucei (strain 927/4 GUTat10.1) TaxID=185431 RepID=Q388A5_TRYB2|nr:hypothetical protein, conserved [Trypanosoma brucei brucei TREU927]EAN78867.1 hypothetical protein, conserved [Trypanosoma brucei brucei TREU927]